jgi:hypothetical protein
MHPSHQAEAFHELRVNVLQAWQHREPGTATFTHL